MTNREIQRLLAAAGYYTGNIDGELGERSFAGIMKILVNAKIDVAGWSQGRKAIGAAQLILKGAGYDPGKIDGYAGHLTEFAYDSWETYATQQEVLKVPRVLVDPTPMKPGKFPLQKNCSAFYGIPGKQVESRLKTLTPVYPMRLDWDLGTNLKTFQLHEACAESAQAAMRKALESYGYYRLKELGLDRYAGAYVNRKMRGSTATSMHAYGAAIDFYAGPNGLHTHSPQALFSKPEYKVWFDCWESQGWISLGREIDRDWMHTQAARLR